jgi:ribosomal-protein-alanine N-acetyltransferase
MREGVDRLLTHKRSQRIETPRLTLREFELSDAKDVFNNIATDSEVTRFLGWYPHSDISVTQEEIQKWINSYDEKSYNWAIISKESNEVIGNIAVVKLFEKDRVCEIGFFLSKKCWGKGIMSEALNAVIYYMINEIGVNRVQARHHIENLASGKVLQKCGMIFEGIMRQAKVDKNGRPYDLAMYAIIKSDINC